MDKVLIINGPNLNLLGSREVAIYGTRTLADLEKELEQNALDLGLKADFFQSNHEGALVDKIHEAATGLYQAIIINAGALTHYSIALHDALKAVAVPVIEVHMSNIYQREAFRHQSFVSPAATGGIFGFGPLSYRLALTAAAALIKE